MLSAEVTFANAVAAAEGVRQAAKASALATYGWNAGGLATYVAALLAADVAYTTAVNTAVNASGLTLGNLCSWGPIPNRVGSLTSIA